MPKDIINYSATIIYKIVCKDLHITDVYVGHTTNFIKRKAQHQFICNNDKSIAYNYKIYSTIRENGNWDNWDMIEIEKYNCNDRNEAAARERYWYEILQANLNIKCPNRNKKESGKEYRDNNKEKISLKYKEYRNNNKEKISLKDKEYYDNNKEKILSKNKDYQQNNKEKLLQKNKEYRINNKEIMKERSGKLCVCEICGKNYTHSNKSHHLRGIFHMSKLDGIK